MHIDNTVIATVTNTPGVKLNGETHQRDQKKHKTVHAGTGFAEPFPSIAPSAIQMADLQGRSCRRAEPRLVCWYSKVTASLPTVSVQYLISANQWHHLLQQCGVSHGSAAL